MSGGRWGPVVLFSSFVNYMLVGAVVYSVGIFFPAFQADFCSSKYQTSWVSSVLNGTLMVEGPLVCACVNRYGCRVVSIFGCLLAAAVFCISTLSTTISFLIVTYGLLGGMALGFVYQPTVVIVGNYFQRRRALAFGIACCGSGIGVFAFAPLFNVFLEKYGWRTTAILVSALILICVVPCAAFKPVLAQRSRIFAAAELERKCSLDSYDMEIIIKRAKNKTGRGENKGTGSHYPHTETDSGDIGVLPSLKTASPLDPTESRSSLSDSSSKADVPDSKAPTKNVSFLSFKLGTIPEEGKEEIGRQHRYNETEVRGDDSNVNRACSSVTTVSTASKASEVITHDLRSTKRSSTTLMSQRLRCRASWLTNLNLLQRPSCIVYCIASFLTSIGFFVPYTFLPTLAEDLHIDSSKASYLISTIGVGNIVARLVAGVLADRYQRVSLPFNNMALVVGGLATSLVPFVSSYPLLLTYSFVFGASIGVVVSLQVVILIDLVGLVELTTALGLTNMFYGIGTFVGPPLAGFVWDATGDYHYAFYLIGVIMMSAGVIGFPLSRIAAWEKRWNKVGPSSRTSF